MTLFNSASALLSPCRKYRYRLARVWNGSLPICPWVCLNPSTADEYEDDPTVRKITGFSARNGYGGFHLFNVLAFRSTDPRGLFSVEDPWGFPKNSPAAIAKACADISRDPAVIAWGAINKRFHQDAMNVIESLGIARCLGYTQGGHPRHPLMLPYSTALEMTGPSRFVEVYPIGPITKQETA